MPTHTSLKGISSVGDSLLSDMLEANLLGFFQWGFLGVGGFFNVTIPTSGAYGGNEHRLRLVSDPNYAQGSVWEGFRKDWVWETGVECPTQPIRVSGVYVNGGFQPATGVGAYAHHVDYPNGRVVFNSPISPTSQVTCEYSHRLFQLYTADAPWWQQVQPDSFRVDDSQFLQVGSGAWDSLAQSRVQLPAVIIEAVPNTSRRPLSVGSENVIVRQDVQFHILSEDRWWYKWLHDAITYQWDKRLQGFDKNLLFTNDRYPLDEYGSPRASGMMYPDLVKGSGDGGFYWEQIRMVDMRSVDQPRVGRLWYATVRLTAEVDRPGPTPY